MSALSDIFLETLNPGGKTSGQHLRESDERVDVDGEESLEAFESGKLKLVKNRSRALARHRKVVRRQGLQSKA